MEKSRSVWSLIVFWLDTILRIFTIGVVYYLVSSFFYERADFFKHEKIIIIIVFSAPALFYFFNILIYFWRNVRSINSRNTTGKRYLLRNKHFSSFLTIIILYSSLMAGLVIFISKPPVSLIPEIKPGTFGIRSWRSIVLVDSLVISYLDSNKHWTRIPDYVIYKSDNWTFPVMHDNPKGKENIYDYSASFDKSTKRIILKKCAAIFNPNKGVYSKVFNNIRIGAKVLFDSIDNLDSYPGFQFLTFVDTIVDYDNEEEYYKIPRFSELCLQFNLNFNDLSHPWIPDLDMYPSILNRSPKKDLEKFGNFKYPLNLKQYYKISAIVYDDQVIFLGHGKYGTCTLFETKINKSNSIRQ